AGLIAASGGATAADEPAAKPTLAAEVMANISADRIKTDVGKLASFRTRHTLSPANNLVRGIGAAEKWLLHQFNDANHFSATKSGFVKAWTESWPEPPQELLPAGCNVTNVMGGIRGVAPLAQDNFVYVVAHYDSQNGDIFDYDGDAPGAN